MAPLESLHVAFATIALDGSLPCSKTSNRDSKGGARDIVKTDSVKEFNRLGVSAMLP